MTSREPGAQIAAASAFLVERYLPPTSIAGLDASVARLARLCAESNTSGGGVQYLHSARLLADDTCFCLFRASSSDAVRDINGRAGFAFDRITEAVLLFGGDDRNPEFPDINPIDRKPSTEK